MRDSLIAFIKSVQEEAMNGKDFGFYGFGVTKDESAYTLGFGMNSLDPRVVMVWETNGDEYDSETMTVEDAVDTLLAS